jgi:hypothetical protein
VLYSDVVATINLLASDETLNFSERSEQISHLLDEVAENDILDHLDRAGIIPESFNHDSTEEKLYAKYCDALLARSLALLGMTATVIAERADSADVLARLQDYEVAGDAKAFRLSRTAKNQKDFKVEALNVWRQQADFATLCAPLYQYPSARSQIYGQATRYNVTLLSYTHLAFLLRHRPQDIATLRELWTVSTTLPETQNATAYWLAVNTCLSRITQTTTEEWDGAVTEMKTRLPELAEEQIRYWQAEKTRIAQLSREQAVIALIDALKIDSKIETIRRYAKNR